MQALFSSVAVIGAGQMGAGIAQVSAMAGFPTLLFDLNPEAVEKALCSMRKRLEKQVERGKQSQENVDAMFANLKTAKDMSSVSESELIIEAIVENTAIKQTLFRDLDEKAPAGTIIASNTSSISITQLASATERAEDFIGLHFMNPVPVMELVEVIRGLQTSDATYERCMAFIRKLNKTAVTAEKDYPGFIVNRILVPMINEAFYVLMEGIAKAEDIDAAMKLGTNQPMGPLELADFVGLDTCLAICEIFHSELGEDKYRPCPLLRKYVEAGWYGRKAGRGVYRY